MKVQYWQAAIVLVFALAGCARSPDVTPAPGPTAPPTAAIFPTLTVAATLTAMPVRPTAPEIALAVATPTFVWEVESAGSSIHLPVIGNGQAPPPISTPVVPPSPTEVVVTRPLPTATEVPPTVPPPTQPPPPTPAPIPSATATAAPPPTAPPVRPTASPPPRAATQPPTGPEMELRHDLPRMTLADWERPAGDNGRCMHWSRNQYFSSEFLDANLPRMQMLGAKWVLVVYADENIITMAAPRFRDAGITPVWRRMLRPHERYYEWARDIDLVKSYGLPPYFQIYNEPSLGQEWVDGWEGEADEALFLDNLMDASRDVYNAGGYVGWQFVSQTWLDRAIDEAQRRGASQIFERFFFIPHSYGDNIPPDWTEDGRGVLGWRNFAEQLHRRLGFVPPLIVGEGGWRINSHDEPRFPPMDDATHARYHVELFDWFRTGVLSNGERLPDYLFAYCPWLISEKGDDNAWWDSFAGDRVQTAEAVTNMPPFTRPLPSASP